MKFALVPEKSFRGKTSAGIEKYVFSSYQFRIPFKKESIASIVCYFCAKTAGIMNEIH